jgi:hypothetical protein
MILVRATTAVPGAPADEPLRTRYVDEAFGWGSLVPAGIRIVDVAGGHSSMLREPWVEDLSRQLGAMLSECVWHHSQTPRYSRTVALRPRLDLSGNGPVVR